MPACLSTLRRKFRSPNAAFPTLQQVMAKASRGRPQSPLALVEKTNIINRKRQPHPLRPIVRAGDFLFFPPNDKKTPLTLTNQGLIGIRQRLILPGRVQPSTFSTGELNFCVRDGNRWNLSVIATGNGSYLITSPFSSCFHFSLSFCLLAFEREGSKLKGGETPLHPDNCTSNDSSDRSN